MPFQMRFRMLSTLLLSLIVPAGSASADMRFNFENCYKLRISICIRKYVIFHCRKIIFIERFIHLRIDL